MDSTLDTEDHHKSQMPHHEESNTPESDGKAPVFAFSVDTAPIQRGLWIDKKSIERLVTTGLSACFCATSAISTAAIPPTTDTQNQSRRGSDASVVTDIDPDAMEDCDRDTRHYSPIFAATSTESA